MLSESLEANQKIYILYIFRKKGERIFVVVLVCELVKIKFFTLTRVFFVFHLFCFLLCFPSQPCHIKAEFDLSWGSSGSEDGPPGRKRARDSSPSPSSDA